jgi:hypothetical protein
MMVLQELPIPFGLTLLMKILTGWSSTIHVPLNLEPAGVFQLIQNGSMSITLEDGQTGTAHGTLL